MKREEDGAQIAILREIRGDDRYEKRSKRNEGKME